MSNQGLGSRITLAAPERISLRRIKREVIRRAGSTSIRSRNPLATKTKASGRCVAEPSTAMSWAACGAEVGIDDEAGRRARAGAALPATELARAFMTRLRLLPHRALSGPDARPGRMDAYSNFAASLLPQGPCGTFARRRGDRGSVRAARPWAAIADPPGVTKPPVVDALGRRRTDGRKIVARQRVPSSAALATRTIDLPVQARAPVLYGDPRAERVHDWPIIRRSGRTWTATRRVPGAGDSAPMGGTARPMRRPGHQRRSVSRPAGNIHYALPGELLCCRPTTGWRHYLLAAEPASRAHAAAQGTSRPWRGFLKRAGAVAARNGPLDQTLGRQSSASTAKLDDPGAGSRIAILLMKHGSPRRRRRRYTQGTIWAATPGCRRRNPGHHRAWPEGPRGRGGAGGG